MSKTTIKKDMNYIIIDTHNGYDDNDEWREAFKEWCFDNDYVYHPSDNSSDIYAMNEFGDFIENYEDWVRGQLEIDEENFWDSVKYSNKKHPERCIVTGHFDSRYPEFYGPNPITLAINPVESLYTAFSKCVKDAYYYKVEVENGVIKFTNYNHDGTNYYEIRLVSEKTYDKLLDDDSVNQEKFMNNGKNFIAPYWELFGC